MNEWLSREKEKMSGLTPGERVRYVWDYYRLWIIGVTAALVILVGGTVHYFTTPGENWFYLCLANTSVEMSEDVNSKSDFCRDFADYAGLDLRKKNLIFDTNCYCYPSTQNYGNTYYEKLIALLDGGILDAVVMEQDEIAALGENGRLLDLNRSGLDLSEWSDRLIYVTPEDESYSTEPVPVGIDLQGTFLTGEDGPCCYPEGCALGISANAPDEEQAEVFLRYLFEEAGA